MKINRTRVFSLLLALLMMLCLLAGCGQSDAPVTDAPAGTPDTPAAADDPSGADNAPSEPADTPSAEGGFVEYTLPLTEDDVTFTYWDMKAPYLMAYDVQYEDFLYYKELENRTGIHLEFTIVPVFTADQSFSVMVAGGDYCDIINNFVQYYKDGAEAAIEDEIIINLADYLDDAMPNYKASLALNKEFIVQSYTDNGYLPAANLLWVETEGVSAGPYIRKDWVDAVGMELPVTYDDYEKLFAAWVTELGKTDFYGLAPYGVDSGNSMSAGFSTAGYQGTESAREPFLVINDVVEYGPTNDGFREYLELMADWFGKGYINRDYTSWTSSGIPLDDQVNGTIGFATTERDRMQTILEMSDDPDIELVGVTLPVKNAGDTVHYRNAEYVIGIGASISTACSDIDLAVKYVDYMYSEDGTFLANYGIVGETCEIDENGDPQLTELVTRHDTYNLTVAANVFTKFSGPMRNYDSRLLKHFQPYILEANEKWLEAEEDYVFPYSAQMSAELKTEYSSIMSEVSTYVMQMTNTFITGQQAINDDTWAEYIGTIEDMNIARAVEIKQISYDNYCARGN